MCHPQANIVLSGNSWLPNASESWLLLSRPLLALILRHRLNERDLSCCLDSTILTDNHHAAAKLRVWLINVGQKCILRVGVGLGNFLDADAHPIN
jgi:hypothetical protein